MLRAVVGTPMRLRACARVGPLRRAQPAARRRVRVERARHLSGVAGSQDNAGPERAWGAGEGAVASPQQEAQVRAQPPQPTSQPQPQQPAPSTVADPAVARASFARLELRVGRILKCWKHPNADRLWVEDVDVGEPQPRRICSGLAKEPLVPQEQMEGASVVVVANLRAVELRKERSHGMLLAAASDDNKKAALVVPPPEARVGDRVFLHGQSADAQAAAPPAPEIDGRAKDGPWAAVAAGLRTDDQGVVCLYGAPLITRAGPLRSALASSAVR